MQKALLIFLFLSLLHGSVLADMNHCDLEVEDRDEADPCVVGLDDAWVNELKFNKNGYSEASIKQYYSDCKGLNKVIKAINEDRGTCNVDGWNTILFKTAETAPSNPDVIEGYDDFKSGYSGTTVEISSTINNC